MNLIKKHLSGKGLGYYLALAALLCSLVALILYRKTGITQFSSSLSSSALTCLWICMALCAVSLVFENKLIKYVAYLICFYGFFGYLQSQVNYIANVFVGIDGNSFTGGFIATLVFFLLAVVLTLLSAALSTWRPWDKAKKGVA